MRATAPLEKTSLYFSEGSSNKEYHAEILEVEGGNVVNFRYGRRGAPLKSGTKTSAPVDLAQARKIYDSLVKEKTSKGYTPAVSGTVYTGTENAGLKTDFVPQLLNPITEDEAMRLINDDAWAAQEKMDGERRAANAVDGIAGGINRKGLSVPLPLPIAEDLLSIADDGIRVDAEIVGDMLYVFDMHVHAGNSIRAKPWIDRMAVAASCVLGCKNITPVPVAITTGEKRALWDKVKAAHGEGIVFKRITGPAKEGRPNSGGDWLKFKFTESASCYVMEVNSGKRSIKIGLLENGARPDVIEGQLMSTVGNVTIPANHNIPSAGDVVEVSYLYAYKGGSLYQPVYRGKRTDLDKAACVTGQLKYKPEGREDDEA